MCRSTAERTEGSLECCPPSVLMCCLSQSIDVDARNKYASLAFFLSPSSCPPTTSADSTWEGGRSTLSRQLVRRVDGGMSAGNKRRVRPANVPRALVARIYGQTLFFCHKQCRGESVVRPLFSFRYRPHSLSGPLLFVWYCSACSDLCSVTAAAT